MGVRVDMHLHQGCIVSPHYDSIAGRAFLVTLLHEALQPIKANLRLMQERFVRKKTWALAEKYRDFRERGCSGRIFGCGDTGRGGFLPMLLFSAFGGAVFLC